MIRNLFPLFAVLFFSMIGPLSAQQKGDVPKMDEFNYDNNKLKISFLGHATLVLDFNGVIIHIDPLGKYADYGSQPSADIILITHEHPDHLDKQVIDKVSKKGTVLIENKAVFEKIKTGTVLENGKSIKVKDVVIEAVPAYNTTAGREKFHPKGRDNGYVLTLGGKKVYIAGDTEDIPEMSSLKDIYIAFLPINQPYTMLPEQAVKAVEMIGPKIFYPYHFGDTDISVLEKLMKDKKGVEMRIRDLK